MDAGSPQVKPSTVSRRFSVAAGFYKTCVIDGLLEHSPAEHVRRPTVPAESPTLGLTDLQFEALLTPARESQDPCDFALVAMFGLLGLRIFEATGADVKLGAYTSHMSVLGLLPPWVSGRLTEPDSQRGDRCRAGLGIGEVDNELAAAGRNRRPPVSRGWMFQVLATGSQKYSASVSPS